MNLRRSENVSENRAEDFEKESNENAREVRGRSQAAGAE
jgi:hypothetical protein